MSTADKHDHDDAAESVTDEMHDNSWSANLEKPQYANDPELAIIDILHTAEAVGFLGG